LSTPVMPAAGTVGFGDNYRRLVDYEKLGAIITNPVTIERWHPASGTRLAPLPGGILVHTGLPNPGLKNVIQQNRQVWEKLPIPVVLHLAGTSAPHMKRAGELIDGLDVIAGIELGLNDDIDEDEAFALVSAATAIEKPLLVRLPFYEACHLAPAALDAGADALVVHDETHPDPSVAFALSRLANTNDVPTPIGVFRAVERSEYGSAVTAQIAASQSKAGPGDLRKLLHSRPTWQVA